MITREDALKGREIDDEPGRKPSSVLVGDCADLP